MYKTFSEGESGCFSLKRAKNGIHERSKVTKIKAFKMPFDITFMASILYKTRPNEFESMTAKKDDILP